MGLYILQQGQASFIFSNSDIRFVCLLGVGVAWQGGEGRGEVCVCVCCEQIYASCFDVHKDVKLFFFYFIGLSMIANCAGKILLIIRIHSTLV